MNARRCVDRDARQRKIDTFAIEKGHARARVPFDSMVRRRGSESIAAHRCNSNAVAVVATALAATAKSVNAGARIKGKR